MQTDHQVQNFKTRYLEIGLFAHVRFSLHCVQVSSSYLDSTETARSHPLALPCQPQ